MAAEARSTDARKLARATLPQLDVTSAVSEIVDEAGEQFKGVLPCISHLATRVADDSVQSFMGAVHRICPMIDEANLITKEVFRDEGLCFELHALTNVFNFGKDVPELVVCLLQMPGALAKFRRSVQTVMHERRQSTDSASTAGDNDTSHLLGNARNPLAHAMGLSNHMRIGDDASLLYVWSLEKFLSRFNTVREVYQAGSDAKDAFASTRRQLEANLDQNPWREIASGDVQVLKERSSSIKFTIPTNSDQHSPAPSSRCTTTPIVSPITKEFDADSLSTSMTSTPRGSPVTTGIDQHASEQTEANLSNERLHRAKWFTSLSSGDESLTSEVSQLQEAVSDTSLQQVSTSNRSEDITRWLSPAEELRTNLKRQKKAKRHTAKDRNLKPRSNPSSKA